MSKARIGVLTLALLVIGGSCYAGYDYGIMYVPYAGGTKIILESRANATDGFDGELALTLPYPSNPVHIATYKTFGVDGWNGLDGFYFEDYRAPLVPSQTITFNDIYLWAEPGTPSHEIQLELSPWIDPTAVTYRLSLVSVPNEIAYSGAMEWGLDDAYILLPFYSTDNGRTGYRFRAEFTAVPEPSSFLTLGMGGLGMLGMALKRRRSR